MTALSLFSGIGGIDLAADTAGIRTVAMCEKDPFCRAVLRKHWPDVPIFEDVKKLRGEDIGEAIDVIHGGFPCQPFSSAGLRRATADSRFLWPNFMRLIRECRPHWVVGENVDGLLRRGLDGVLHDLESDNYTCRAFSIPAGAVGAPHRRHRIFVVANANGDRQQGGQYESGDGRIEVSWLPGRNTPKLFTPIGGFPRRDDLPTPRICRASDGIPCRIHRLHALGSAVVPAQIYPIFRAIAEIEGRGE
jgi:DNA (cytosine-5)-methyltransferase 1